MRFLLLLETQSRFSPVDPKNILEKLFLSSSLYYYYFFCFVFSAIKHTMIKRRYSLPESSSPVAGIKRAWRGLSLNLTVEREECCNLTGNLNSRWEEEDGMELTRGALAGRMVKDAIFNGRFRKPKACFVQERFEVGEKVSSAIGFSASQRTKRPHPIGPLRLLGTVLRPINNFQGQMWSQPTGNFQLLFCKSSFCCFCTLLKSRYE